MFEFCPRSAKIILDVHTHYIFLSFLTLPPRFPKTYPGDVQCLHCYEFMKLCYERFVEEVLSSSHGDDKDESAKRREESDSGGGGGGGRESLADERVQLSQ